MVSVTYTEDLSDGAHSVNLVCIEREFIPTGTKRENLFIQGRVKSVWGGMIEFPILVGLY